MEKKVEVESKSKLSYKELEGMAHQLSEQSKKLYLQNQELQKKLVEFNNNDYFKRLDYLWNIITLDSSKSIIFNDGFVKKCIEEFELMMTPPVIEEEETKED